VQDQEDPMEELMQKLIDTVNDLTLDKLGGRS
jgi:hypothetical protein